MKQISLLLLFKLGWLSAALLYHEESIREFGSGVTANKNSFGYSVTFTPDNNRLIVGAPKGNDVGALFTCEIESRNCTQIITKIEAPDNYHIWLGASVRAGSDFFATCAPRFFEKSGVFSRCYKYFTRKNDLKVLRDKQILSQSFEHRMTTFGWSMDVDNNDNVLVGGPAMYKGRATIYEFSNRDIAKDPPILVTYENVQTNFGYSVLHRLYKGEKQIVVSSTYGEHGLGLVLLRDFQTGAIISKIRGKQVGSMFGASLCAASVDSDGQSVLIVGAPTYALENMYNSGAVYVYKDNNTDIYREVFGNSNGGQFGYALANLGDLNGDKKDEIAISAPYEDDGHGVVYIYSGAHLLDRDKPAPWLQRIKREKYYSFGLSLYAVPDYDKNGCKELAIGAPQSNTTVLLQCLATITVTVKELKPRGKLSNTTGYASFIFESCLAFKYPLLPKNIEANFSVQVDIPNLKIELSGFSKNDTLTYHTHVTSEKKQEYCRNLTVSTPMDKPYEPTLHYQISATLLNDPRDMATFSPSRVTTSDLSVLTVPGIAWIAECANGKKCTPKLEMKVFLSASREVPYIVGSTNEETVSISVKNEGDPAYSACLRVYLYGITLHRTPSSCMMSPAGDQETIVCRPIKLLRNNTSWDIDDIKLDTKSIMSSSNAGEMDFRVSVHLYDDCSTRATTKMWDGKVSLKRDSEHVTVIGVIKQNGLINITRNEIETSSKQIQHEYIIRNDGPTTWNDVRAIISLQKESFLDGISTISGPGYDCQTYDETEKEYISNCKIRTLRKNQKLEIVLPIDIMSNILETLKKRELKVTSHLKILLGGDEKSGSVTSTLRLFVIKVETWILIVAVLFGIVIIMIIAFILYECGFLRRKKKEDLRELRKSVRRQSMRRSTVIRHSVKENSDQENLIEVSDAEEAVPDDQGPRTSTKAEVCAKVHEEENETNKESDNKTPVELDTSNIDKNGQVAKALDSDASIKADCLKGKENEPLANIIIGGLQKNLRRRDVQPQNDN